jgi:hypothetical protein
MELIIRYLYSLTIDGYIFLDRSLIRWDSLECEVWTLIRFGSGQVEYGSRDVFYMMRGRWRWVGVAETELVVGGGYVGGV